jgi:hypothetical protein
MFMTALCYIYMYHKNFRWGPLKLTLEPSVIFLIKRNRELKTRAEPAPNFWSHFWLPCLLFTVN